MPLYNHGMSNRRRYARRSCAELINICTDTRKDRAGLAKDLSPSGMRFQSRSRFAVGERVDLVMQLPSLGKRTASGRIVRTSTKPDYTSIFPHGAVVEFDLPYFDLVATAQLA